MRKAGKEKKDSFFFLFFFFRLGEPLCIKLPLKIVLKVLRFFSLSFFSSFFLLLSHSILSFPPLFSRSSFPEEPTSTLSPRFSFLLPPFSFLSPTHPPSLSIPFPFPFPFPFSSSLFSFPSFSHGKKGEGTALHVATMCGHKEMVAFLLKEKANPNIRDKVFFFFFSFLFFFFSFSFFFFLCSSFLTFLFSFFPSLSLPRTEISQFIVRPSKVTLNY